MLTLFILKSGNKDADPKKSLQSFIGLVTQTYYLNSLPEINAAGKENDWFAVIYDDEVVGKGLMDVTLMKDGETMNYCPLKVHLMQTKADVAGRPLEVSQVEDASPLGAAMLAGIGLGLYQDAEDAYDRLEHPSATLEPDPQRAALYARWFKIYQQLYPATCALNRQLFQETTT